ncbi:MAG: P-loop NTPase, partial [Bryobacteraceae bacterium]
EDARKAVHMFHQVKVEILGIVENMSYLVLPTGERMDVFGQGGGRTTARDMGVHFLGEVPLDPEIRIGGDTGLPVALRGDGDPHAEVFVELARRVIARLEQIGPQTGPSIEISD